MMSRAGTTSLPHFFWLKIKINDAEGHVGIISSSSGRLFEDSGSFLRPTPMGRRGVEACVGFLQGSRRLL